MCQSNINKALSYAKNVKCVFEIGAYDGVDIDEIETLLGPSCSIHAFEPDFESFSILKTLYGDKQNIILNQIAISNIKGTTKFIKCLDPKVTNQADRSLWYKTNQSLRHNTDFHRMDAVEQEYDVNVTTLDDYCRQNSICPDILLVDTQGSEWEIFDGSKSILTKVQVILTEWSTKELYQNQKMLPDIVTLLQKYGFTLKEKINLWDDFHGDAIFVKE
jgi:FkbM family methyltransferase